MVSIQIMLLTFVLLSTSLAYYSYCSPSGLTLGLIPPHSPKSPLFIPNLTSVERIQMLVQQSHTRAHHLSDMLSSTLHQNDSKYSIQQDLLPIPVITKIRDSLMVVEIGIGTFNNGAYKSYLLMMDTGGTNIWIQCEDCLKPKGNCYPQKEDYFPNSKSISYLPYKPRLTYAKIYMGGTTSSGVYAYETFTFPSTSSSNPLLKMPATIFGCGTKNYSPRVKDKSFEVAGVFGMGMDRFSFIRQIENVSMGRFSYCFVHMDIQNPPPMYLRFGTNIKPPQSSITINFLKLYEPRYMVNVVDLGVNKEHLHINKIKLYSGKIKGFLVDPGSPISHLSKGAYDVVVSKLDKHFSQHKGEFRKENQEGWLCYSRINGAQGYSNVPGITYYFEGGAQLDVNPEDTFFRQRGQGREEILCLAILQSKFEQNILGAYQQVNYKFIYNIKDKTLQFGREDCAKNG